MCCKFVINTVLIYLFILQTVIADCDVLSHVNYTI